MGLDLQILAKLKNKKTGRETVLELAYWRKAYAIRDMLVDIAQRYYINNSENYEDVVIYCSPPCLNEIISNLILELQNINSPLWTCSVFDAPDTRGNTLKNLDSILTFRDWIDNECDGFVMYEHCYDVEKKNKADFEGFETADCFEIFLEIINSY